MKQDTQTIQRSNEQRIKFGRASRLSGYLADLRRRGYEDHCNADDTAVCRATVCPECGKMGMEAITLKGPEYVAVAACTGCNYWMEF